MTPKWIDLRASERGAGDAGPLPNDTSLGEEDRIVRKFLGLCARCELPVWMSGDFYHLPDGTPHTCDRPFEELARKDSTAHEQ